MLIKLYQKNNSPTQIERIITVLKDGGTIILPTDTTYVFACHALKERAVEQICRLKHIDPAKHPLSIICYDMSAISEYARITTPTYKIMKRNLPGLFTFILPAFNKLPKIFRSKKGNEVGIRMPDNNITHIILQALGAPLMTSSLPMEDNDPGFLTNPELIQEKWEDKVTLIIDGGICELRQSTIVDCTDTAPTIVRQGDGFLV